MNDNELIKEENNTLRQADEALQGNSVPQINKVQQADPVPHVTYEVCRANVRAIHDTLDVIGGKWKMSIISCLTFQPMRFSELLREVDGISGKMLSRELKELEMNQLISREVLNTQPITVRYQLTPYGETLKYLTHTIADWGINHRKKIIG